MSDFKSKLEKIRAVVPEHVKIIAVSKTKPIEVLSEAYAAGQRIFGENKVQELVSKYPLLEGDTEWHMIGHLQTNKVKMIAPFISMIHAVDSLKLLDKIQNEASKVNRKIPCLIQAHIAKEETKFGFSPDEVYSLFQDLRTEDYPNVVFSGLMGMASFTDDEELVLEEFGILKELFDRIKSEILSDYDPFVELSMGMTSDFHLAIQKGSTMIRIGTLLFGGR